MPLLVHAVGNAFLSKPSEPPDDAYKRLLLRLLEYAGNMFDAVLGTTSLRIDGSNGFDAHGSVLDADAHCSTGIFDCGCYETSLLHSVVSHGLVSGAIGCLGERRSGRMAAAFYQGFADFSPCWLKILKTLCILLKLSDKTSPARKRSVKALLF